MAIVASSVFIFNTVQAGGSISFGKFSCRTTPSSMGKIILPVVSFEAPGAFTDQEKFSLQQKLVNPYFDYNNDKGIQMIAIVISPSKTAGYLYEIYAISKTGGYESFLWGTPDQPLEYWVPGCMGPCKISAKFAKKYPYIAQIVKNQK